MLSNLTLAPKRSATKQQLCYFSLLLALAFTTSTVHAQEIIVIGTPAAFNSGVMSSFTGANPPSQPSGGQASSPSFIAEQIAKARKACTDGAELAFNACNTTAGTTYATNLQTCFGYTATGASLTAIGLKGKGWIGGVIALAGGITTYYGTSACPAIAQADRDVDTSICTSKKTLALSKCP